jgi:hypothetical protein
MITSFNLGTNGRLGNQLFQYAALKAVGLENNYEVKIPNPNSATWHGQECLLGNFNISSNFLTREDAASIKYIYNEQDHTKVDLSIFNIEDYTTLSGFFQSLKYFEKYKDQIFKELTPKDKFMKEAEAYVSDIGNSVIGIHVRRGDYVVNTDITEEYLTYVRKAVSLFPSSKFLVFSGGKRVEGDNQDDIKWCKDNLGIDAFYSESSDTMKDFSRIIACDGNILSPSSSFGLWAGHLNSNNGKKVVAPLKYDPFSNNTHESREGLYSSNFIIV